MKPAVSCILVTRDRPAFFRQALRCFSLQDYQRKELIVVDDGDIPVKPLCEGLTHVTYLRLASPTPTGTKLNLGIEAAHGDILQKLDDDDFYASGFLSAAVAHLRRARRSDALVAWCCFPVLIANERRLFFSGHGWKAGGTLCFRRSLWKRCPFRDIYASSDSWFVRDTDPHVVPVCASDQYLLVRHGANTWRDVKGFGAAENYFRLRPSARTIADVVGPRHLAFYRSLMSAGAEPRPRATTH